MSTIEIMGHENVEALCAHRILEAADLPPGHQQDFALTIAWPDGRETIELVSENAGRLLGFTADDQEPRRDAQPATAVLRRHLDKAMADRACHRARKGKPASIPLTEAGIAALKIQWLRDLIHEVSGYLIPMKDLK